MKITVLLFTVAASLLSGCSKEPTASPELIAAQESLEKSTAEIQELRSKVENLEFILAKAEKSNAKYDEIFLELQELKNSLPIEKKLAIARHMRLDGNRNYRAGQGAQSKEEAEYIARILKSGKMTGAEYYEINKMLSSKVPGAYMPITYMLLVDWSDEDGHSLRDSLDAITGVDSMDYARSLLSAGSDEDRLLMIYESHYGDASPEDAHYLEHGGPTPFGDALKSRQAQQ